jgi:hypothetical protein
MNLTFQIENQSLESFIEHWSQRYFYGAEEKYINNIGKPLTEKSRLELYEWKNGSKISKKKWDSVVNNYPLTFSGDLKERYLNHNKSGGAIWNIFYLHCLNPQEWPIYDQHTYRAMMYIKTGAIQEIGTTDMKKYDSYINEYIPFFTSLGVIENRKADKALFAFGQFLKIAAKYA